MRVKDCKSLTTCYLCKKKKLMMNIHSFLKILALILVASACNTNKKVGNETDVTDNQSTIMDSTKIQIDVAAIETMSVRIADNSPVIINKEDHSKLAATAKYDTKMNESGIMLKIAAPEYDITLHYKGKSAAENESFMIWKSGLAKFNLKWFLLAGDHKEAICQILEKYRVPVK